MRKEAEPRRSKQRDSKIPPSLNNNTFSGIVKGKNTNFIRNYFPFIQFCRKNKEDV